VPVTEKLQKNNQASDFHTICGIISQVEFDFGSFICVQHLAGAHFAGITGSVITSGLAAVENTNKLTEPADNKIKRQADFFKRIYSSFG